MKFNCLVHQILSNCALNSNFQYFCYSGPNPTHQKLENLDPTHGSTQPMDNSDTVGPSVEACAGEHYFLTVLNILERFRFDCTSLKWPIILSRSPSDDGLGVGTVVGAVGVEGVATPPSVVDAGRPGGPEFTRSSNSRTIDAVTAAWSGIARAARSRCRHRSPGRRTSLTS